MARLILGDLMRRSPTIKEAREWLINWPGQSNACFAAKYPGMYAEAAKLARQARREIEEEE